MLEIIISSLGRFEDNQKSKQTLKLCNKTILECVIESIIPLDREFNLTIISNYEYIKQKIISNDIINPKLLNAYRSIKKDRTDLDNTLRCLKNMKSSFNDVIFCNLDQILINNEIDEFYQYIDRIKNKDVDMCVASRAIKQYDDIFIKHYLDKVVGVNSMNRLCKLSPSGIYWFNNLFILINALENVMKKDKNAIFDDCINEFLVNKKLVLHHILLTRNLKFIKVQEEYNKYVKELNSHLTFN